MATGVGMGFDLGGLDKTISKIEKQLDDTVKQSRQAQDAYKKMFDIGTKGGLNMLNQLEKLSQKMSDMSGSKKLLKLDSKGLSEYLDKVNRLISLIDKANVGNGVDLINAESLKNAAEQYKSLLSEMKKNERRQTYSGALKYSDNAKLSEQDAKAIEYLKAAREKLKQTDADYANKLEKLNSAIEKHNQKLKDSTKTEGQRAEEAKRNADKIIREKQREEKELERQRKREEKEYYATPKSALEYARGLNSGVKSINTMNLALSRLKEAQNGLDRNTKNWKKEYKNIQKEIKLIEEELGKAKSTQDGFSQSAGRLKMAFAAAFSVSAIKGYVRQVFNVRAELQMQHVALTAIVRDVDKVNTLWSQITQLSVKSPFRVDELITYTKQLAAYRVESEKLFSTTKMLADVSAGLGVDMQRLILAFGQVKAATVLRATELRQFTEAGVNMLDELVSYFKEVKGQTYSTGEVFDMISRRMVEFKDVEAVFERMTSEGGMFYQMQEKQSMTLKGQISNLKDAYTLMLNDIGKSNESVFSDFIEGAKWMIKHWREIMHAAKTAFLVFAGFKTIKFFSRLYVDISRIVTAIKRAEGATKKWAILLRRLSMSNILGIALTIGSFFFDFTTGADSASYAIENFNSKIAEFQERTQTLKKSLVELLKTIDDASASTTDVDNAYKQLNREYGEYLTSQQLEISNIQSLNGNYNELIETFEKVRLVREKETARGEVKEMFFNQDEYMHAADEAYRFFDIENQKFFKEFQGLITKVQNGVITTQEQFIIEYLKIFDIAEEEWREFYENSALIGLDDIIGHYGKSQQEALKNIYNTLGKDGERAKEIAQAINILTRMDDYVLQSLEVEKVYANAIDYAEEAANKLKSSIDFAPLTEDDLQKNKELLGDFLGYYKAWAKEFAKTNEGVYEYQLNKWYNIFVDKAKKIKAEYEKSRAEDVTKTYQKLLSSGRIKTEFNDEDLRNLFQIKIDKSTNENLDLVIQKVKALQDYIDTAQKMKESGSVFSYLYPDEEVQKAKDQITVFQELWGEAIFGKKTKDTGIEKLKKQIQLVKQLADNYDEMREKYGKLYADANIKSQERFDAFRELGLNLNDFAVGTRENLLNNLKILEEFANTIEGGMAELKKSEAEVQVDIKWRNQEESNKQFAQFIEDMFNNYELTLELDKLNIPRDVAQSLFGFKALDISDLRKKILDKKGLGGLASLTTASIFDSDEYKTLDKKAQDEIRNSLNKIDDLETKSQEERLKKYIKYLEKAQTERVKIKLDEVKQLADIEKTFVLTQRMAEENVGMTAKQYEMYKLLNSVQKSDKGFLMEKIGLTEEQVMLLERQNNLLLEQANIAKAGVKRESEEKMAKQEWEDFSKSFGFITIFDDLDKLSNKSLTNMIDKLNTLKKSLKASNLPASEMKEIYAKIAQLEAEIGERNPFYGWGGTSEKGDGVLSYWKNMKERESKLEELDRKEKEFTKRQDELNKYLGETSTDEFSADKYNELTNAIENAGVEVRKAEDAFQEADEKFSRSAFAVKQISEAYNFVTESLNQIPDAIQDLLTSFGVLSDEQNAIFDSLQQTIQSAVGVAGNIAKIAMNPVDVTAYVGLITNLIQLISSAAQTGDAVIDSQIQKESKQLDLLQKRYEQLEEQIKQAYSIDRINEYHNAAMSNIDEQITAIRKMRDAEESKKKTDADAVGDYNDEIDELLKKRDDAEREYLEKLGGVGGEANYGDIISDFVDAWLDGFMEVGDGIDALNEHFDDFIKNLVQKQLAARVVSASLREVLNHIDKSIADDGLFDSEEWNQLMKLKDDALPKLNEALEKVINETGMAAWAGKDSELGSLSGSISNISEETADVLAGYLNSIRFFVADSNLQLQTLVALQGGASKAGVARTNDDSANPMLPQLRMIVAQTTAINDLLQSLVRGGHSMGGTGLKVFIS